MPLHAQLTGTLKKWALTLAVAVSILPAFGHADLEQQITEVTAQLHTNANHPELLLQRSDLHRRHADYAKANADLDTVDELRPNWSFALLARARTQLESSNFIAGLSTTDRFLKQETHHPDGLIVRARCLVKLQRLPAAVADFSLAIAALPTPMPDLLIERARAQAVIGRLEDAVAGLDEGLRKLGAVPTLQLAAIEYERQLANFDGALARVDRISARYPRKEPWLALRGEVLEQAGRLTEARATFQQVLSIIETYPPVRRQLDLTRQLETRVRTNLTRVEGRLRSTATAKTISP